MWQKHIRIRVCCFPIGSQRWIHIQMYTMTITKRTNQSPRSSKTKIETKPIATNRMAHVILLETLPNKFHSTHVHILHMRTAFSAPPNRFCLALTTSPMATHKACACDSAHQLMCKSHGTSSRHCYLAQTLQRPCIQSHLPL